jgi:hypothetical protein
MIIRNDNITPAQVRRLLRDPKNRQDKLFLGTAFAKGALNFRFMQSTPTAVKRIVPNESQAKYGTNRYGLSAVPKLRYKDNLRFKNIIPERQYNPVVLNEISNSTKLGKGISVSMFAKNYLAELTFEERKEVAKHLYLQTFLINGVRINTGRFAQSRLTVAEGLFFPETTYTITPGNILELQGTGRVAVYDVTDEFGNPDPAGAFNIACYFKDSMMFDELILSYDTVDPNQNLTAQIIVTMPKVDNKYIGNFRRIIRTEYNFNVALRNGLAELVV